MENRTPNRVSYSFGMKLSIPGKYESSDFHVSLTTDQEGTETVSEAFNRAQQEVLAQAEKLYVDIRGSETGLITTSPPQKQSPRSEATANPLTLGGLLGNVETCRSLIKSAFTVLEAQKKTTKAEFKQKYLNNLKVDELQLNELQRIKIQLAQDFPELGL